MRGRTYVWKWTGPLVLVLVSGCTAESADAPAATQPPAGNDLFTASAMAALPPAGFTPADLPDPESDGAVAIAQYCTACHALPTPTAHSATDWPAVMRRMWLRIERVADDFDVPVPDAAERLLMSNYVIEHALQVTSADLPDFVGREYFLLTCDRCHELPDPKSHGPQDWPTVVVRMQRHMVDLLGDSPVQAEIRDIITYLERISGS